MPAWAMKYEKRKALRGVATIKQTKLGYRITFLNDASGTIYDIEADKVPENMRTGKWHVSMNSDGTQVYSISPVTGAFVCKFQRIAAAEGQLPAPKHYSTQFKNEDGSIGVSEYDAFTVILEILEPKEHAGLTLPYFLRYYFGEVEGSVAFIKPKSKYSVQLYDFLQAAGAFLKGEMAWSENILPALEKRLQESGKRFHVTIKEGLINSIVEMEAG